MRSAPALGVAGRLRDRARVPASASLAWVAVTGTNGKTTTTALDRAPAAGRSGIAARGRAATSARRRSPRSRRRGRDACSWPRSPRSSCALTRRRSSPRVAVLLNITPDHVDWHGSLEAYAADKAKVFANMGAGRHGRHRRRRSGLGAVRGRASRRAGCGSCRVSHRPIRPAAARTCVDGVLIVDASGEADRASCASDELRHPGRAQREQRAGRGRRGPRDGRARRGACARGCATFEPIEHRLEPVGAVAAASSTTTTRRRRTRTRCSRRSPRSTTGRSSSCSEAATRATTSPSSPRRGSARCRLAVLFGESAPEIVRRVRGAGGARDRGPAVEAEAVRARGGGAARARSCCCRPRARASTSSSRTSTAAGSSSSWWRDRPAGHGSEGR